MDTFQKCVVNAILGGSYLIAGSIMFVGVFVIISFIPDVSPKVFKSIISLGVLAMFFYVAGFISLVSAARDLK